MMAMTCEACGCVTQPETVIVMRRRLGRVRAETRQGWYCWTCKASGSAPDRPPPPPSLPREARAF